MDETKVNTNNTKELTMEQVEEKLKNYEQEHLKLTKEYEKKEQEYNVCLRMIEDDDSNDVKEFLKRTLEKYNNNRYKALWNTYFAFKKYGEFAIQVQHLKIKQLNKTIIYLKEQYPEIQKEFSNVQTKGTNPLNTEEIKQKDDSPLLEEVKQDK